MKANCKRCEKEFDVWPSYVKRGGGQYCSRSCASKSLGFKKGDKGYWTGKKRSDLVHTNAATTMFRKGSIPFNKGVSHLPEERNPAWKGDDVGYRSLHKWVSRKLGDPSKCDICGSTNRSRYEWANKSGEYKRDLSDWLRLCKSCHVNYDMDNGFWGNLVNIYPEVIYHGKTKR